MGKKMKLPFLSNSKTPSEAIRSPSSSWPWPSCTQTRTLSFRVGNDIFKTLNSAYFDPATTTTTTTTTTQVVEPPDDSFFSTNFSDRSCPSFSTATEDSGGESIETVIKGLRSERLFFEPKAGETSSIILEEETNDDNHKAAHNRKLEIIPFKESVALSMDSPDPIVDFRKSMEEMVEAHGLKDWEHLEELLCWYLRANGKSNHGYIVGAFVDLLVGLALSTNANCTTNCSCDVVNSPSSPLSFYNSTSSTSSSSSSSTPCASSKEESEGTTVCLSSLLEAEEDEISEEDDDDDDGASS